jgi:hypothetical protein
MSGSFDVRSQLFIAEADSPSIGSAEKRSIVQSGLDLAIALCDQAAITETSMPRTTYDSDL